MTTPWYYNCEADVYDYFCSLEMLVRREHSAVSGFYQGRYPTPLPLRDDRWPNEENQ